MYLECSALKQWFGVAKARINEGINQVTMIELDLVTRDQPESKDMDELVGKPITVVVEDDIDGEFHKSRWDGVVFEYLDATSGQDDNGVYFFNMVIRPTLWNLNYFVHSRSYADMSRIEVIDELLKEHSISDGTGYTKNYFQEKVYPKFNQIQQTATSDLVFFEHVLSNAGISYYFSADNEGEEAEKMHLVDNNAFFPNVKDPILIVPDSGMVRATRRVESITKQVRSIPEEVSSAVSLADGATKANLKDMAAESTAGILGKIHKFVPEGGQDAEGAAKHVTQVVIDDFNTKRMIYRGVANHIRIRPGKRLTLDDVHGAGEFKVLAHKVQHYFEQSRDAALSEEGSGDMSYKSHFVAYDPNSTVRPSITNPEVDLDFSLDSLLDLDLNSGASSSPKFTFEKDSKFNAQADPAANTQALGVLLEAVATVQTQIMALSNRMDAMQSVVGMGSGLVVAEITEDAWVTKGKELVCKVKSEEFEEPITVKVSAAWHTKGGGSLFLPRTGNHGWIQKIYGSQGNGWVIVG